MRLLRLTCATFLALPVLACNTGRTTIVLHPDSTYQTIVGWESHTQSGEVEVEQFPLYRDELFDVAVNELGINRLRLQAYSGLEHERDFFTEWQDGTIDYQRWLCARFETADDNGDPDVIDWSGFHFSQMDRTVREVILPIRKRLEANGEKLYLNVNYNAFVLKCPGTPYHHLRDPDEYAEFALAVFLHLRDEFGIVPDAWEVILEPDNTEWTGRAIGEALVRTARLLERHGFSPDFIAPSNTNMANAIAFFDEMIQVPGVLDYLTEFSYHRYGGVSAENLAAIGERAVRYGVRTSMLEHIGSGHRDLHQDLAIGRNSAWQQFALAYRAGPDRGDDPGGVYFPVDVRSDPDSPVVRWGRRTRFLRQYFHYVRAGAVRIGATSDDADFEPLAFVNADGGHVVIVKGDRGRRLSIVGLPEARYEITYTTRRDAGVAHEPVDVASGDTLATTLPAEGVLTVSRTRVERGQ